MQGKALTLPTLLHVRWLPAFLAKWKGTLSSFSTVIKWYFVVPRSSSACRPTDAVPAGASNSNACAEPQPAQRCLHTRGHLKRAATSPGDPISSGRWTLLNNKDAAPPCGGCHVNPAADSLPLHVGIGMPMRLWCEHFAAVNEQEATARPAVAVRTMGRQSPSSQALRLECWVP